MGSKVNRVNSKTDRNVVHGAFGTTPPSSKVVSAKQLPNKQEVHDNLKRGANQLPNLECTQNDLRQTCMSFANDFGLNPNADVEHKAKSVTNSVALRQQIASIREELAGQLGELRERSNKIIHVAESTGHWITDAERFVQRHPHLLWFLKHSK